MEELDEASADNSTPNDGADDGDDPKPCTSVANLKNVVPENASWLSNDSVDGVTKVASRDNEPCAANAHYDEVKDGNTTDRSEEFFEVHSSRMKCFRGFFKYFLRLQWGFCTGVLA